MDRGALRRFTQSEELGRVTKPLTAIDSDGGGKGEQKG
ncbi:hypothetical protein A2U01_0050203, partial [Trifolium medium]|nr:hypothetical protein [Trifolium medium]